MIINRWTAPIAPTAQQAEKIFQLEGLEPFEEKISPNEKVGEHRHPFSEVRILISGEMLFNVAGNQILLRQGDRIEIPANTKHAHSSQNAEALCVCAYKLV